MKLRIICLSAFAVSLSVGAAFAGASTGTSALDDPAKMSPFYTDANMKTMRSGDEFKKAWLALTEDDRASMKKDCDDATIAAKHSDFCKMRKDVDGAN
jgi:hypothetical protein